ncbi:GlcG/HbpS family heme-binding protein [Vibrio agarivorans]|uniref:Heme-binding protein n=1 Tax=Vibrio agarivorans TaxID=153622 RepID=A0ABT7Y224_9VIBR|nr:heme-binding protein [Vibrio agarivorans]MDN2482091.1 heme-binding protein [Vibrio agarivorans]
MKLTRAQQILSRVEQQATNNNQSIAAAIVDSHGELIAFLKMDDCSPQAALLAQNKAYTSARDRQPSGDLGQWARDTGKDLSYWNDAKITGFKGGIPITEKGTIIGAIGISGLSEEDDEGLAKWAIEAIGD